MGRLCLSRHVVITLSQLSLTLPGHTLGPGHFQLHVDYYKMGAPLEYKSAAFLCLCIGKCIL